MKFIVNLLTKVNKFFLLKYELKTKLIISVKFGKPKKWFCTFINGEYAT